MSSLSASHEREVGLTQVLPFDTYLLAVDLDIAGASAENATTAYAPMRKPNNILLVCNIITADNTAAKDRHLVRLYRM